MIAVAGTGTVTSQELACIAAEHQTAKHTVELVPGKGQGQWAPMATPHATVEAPAPCTAVVPYRGTKAAALTVASTPPSARSFMCTSPAETMVSLCNRFVAEANSTAAKPYLFRDNVSLPGRSINVDAALAMLPGGIPSHTTSSCLTMHGLFRVPQVLCASRNSTRYNFARLFLHAFEIS